MTDRLEDYVDVAERIAVFHDQYPEGSLQTLDWDVRQVGDRLFIVYQALCFRHPEDGRPGHGTAWEPFPGPTPFTRDSELMNAETAAWGRAIVAIGIVASRKLATRQDVQARQGAQEPQEAPEAPAEDYGRLPAHRRPSAAQETRIKGLIKTHKVSRLELAGILDQWDLELSEGWMDRLTPGRDGTASRLISTLEQLEKPQVDA